MCVFSRWFAVTVHHILPEGEPFSERFGGALSRWAANVLANDKTARILAPSSDGTWKMDSGRIHVSKNLRRYGQLVAESRDRIPLWLRKPLIAASLKSIVLEAAAGDVVYVHNRPGFAAAIESAYPHRQFKLVLHMQNSHLLHQPKEFAQCADLTVFCSEFLMQEARKHVGEIRSALIPNGADGSYFFPDNLHGSTDPPTVLFVGRLVVAKGPHVLMDAMRILQKRGTCARAVIVGSAAFGDDKQTSYVRGLRDSAPSNVEFRPYATGVKVADEFRQATVFCCPSVFEEPFGMVNVEAMACGLPVVASAVGGIPEVFREGGALLVPSSNPEKLANALDHVLRNRDLRTQLAAEGQRSFRKNYTWDVVRRKYLDALALIA